MIAAKTVAIYGQDLRMDRHAAAAGVKVLALSIGPNVYD
jgi:hypothetical protein